MKLKTIACVSIGLFFFFAFVGYKTIDTTEKNRDSRISRITLNKKAQKCFQRGIQLYNEKNFELAIKSFEQSIDYDPHEGNAYVFLGYIAEQQNNIDKAIEYYNCSLKTNPKNTAALRLLAKLNMRQETIESFTKAAHYLNTAQKIEPNDYESSLLLSESYLKTGQTNAALQTLQTMIDCGQDTPVVEVMLGKVHERENQIEKSIDYYKRAIELNSDHAIAHVSLAGAYWATGNLKDGFKEYEWRWELSNMKHVQRWDGKDDPKDKEFLLLSENGFGDIIQFVRFAKDIKERGAKKITLLVPKPLMNIMSLCDYIDAVIEPPSNAPHDYVTSIQSIPACLDICTATLTQPPYMQADQQLIEYWKEKIKNDPNFKVGLCWASGNDKGFVPQGKRSIHLQTFAPIANMKNVAVYSLQKGEHALKQLNEINFNIVDFGPTFDKKNGAFMDTAALMQNLDLIISIDTSVAHLAGALNVPTITLLPFTPDPRWMLDRTDSPWYPSMTLMRNERDNNWNNLIEKVVNKIENMKI